MYDLKTSYEKNRENEVKVNVLNELIKRRRLRRGSIVANEYPLHGTGVRADLAFLQRRKIVGIEIKTEADSLRRLKRQIEIYKKTFDLTILVVANKHLTHIFPQDFPGIEIWSYDRRNNFTKIASKKADPHERMSPEAEAEIYLNLLTKNEAKKFEGSRLRPKYRHIEAFRERYIETSDKFWEILPDDIVTAESLEYLSKFKQLRSKQKQLSKEMTRKLDAWSNFD